MKPSSSRWPKYVTTAFVGFFVLLFLSDLVVMYSFSFTVNSGMVFGSLPYNSIAIILSLILLVLLFLLAPKTTKRDYLTLALCGGAVVTNIIERVLFGGVIDYAPLFAGIRFNLSDLVIIVTIVLIFWRKLTN